MTLSAAAPVDQIAESFPLLAPVEKFHLEPRCRVCRSDDLRRKVNGLLATGSSYAMVVRAIEEDNAALDKRDRVTIDSIRNHTARHFPVQNVAQATYRQILERRAEQNGIDFVNGVTTALTPMAFFEILMLKAFESLIDPDTKVDVGVGMVAAGRLQALLDTRTEKPDFSELRRRVDQIGEAVRTTVPQRCGLRSCPSSMSWSSGHVTSTTTATISPRLVSQTTATTSTTSSDGFGSEASRAEFEAESSRSRCGRRS
jgi:hypothetical protein